MASLLTAVFKATVGLLVQKGLDAAADKLKQGDITDQKLRDVIVREIHDVKSKLDGLARKDLLSAIDFFEEGITLLYDLPQLECSPGYDAEDNVVSLPQAMSNLKLTQSMDEASTSILSRAKKRFEDCRRKATEAFNDEALKPSDRIVAMGYRVMATVLETVDNPTAALSACRLCIERLHSLPAVQNCFSVELKKGLRGWFSKDERREIITAICRVNRVIYDVTCIVYGFGNKELQDITQTWPCINIDNGNMNVNPMIDERVANSLRKRGMNHFSARWSFGQEGEEKQRLKQPGGMATNTQGGFIVTDYKDCNVKAFDSTGKFLYSFYPGTNEKAKDYKGGLIHDVATDKKDNIYVLLTLKMPGADEEESFVYLKTSDQFLPLRGGFRSWSFGCSSLAISDNDKVLVRGEMIGGHYVVDVYEKDGQFVSRFGEGILKGASSIAAANDGCIIVADHEGDSYHVYTFSEEGEQLSKFTVQRSYHCPQTTFHQASEHFVVAGIERGAERRLQIVIYSKNGEIVRSIEHNETDVVYLRGIAVSADGRIGVVYKQASEFKILVV